MRTVTSKRDIGDNSFIDPSVHVLGWNRIAIGSNTIVAQDTSINVNDRSIGEKSLLIGNNSFIGRRNFLNVGKKLRLGDYTMTGPNCQFIGAGHVFEDPFMPYISTGTTLQSIEVGANCWFGSGAIVIGNVRIGHGCIIGAGAVVRSDVPPFSMVVGAHGTLKRRYAPPLKQWVNIEAFLQEWVALIPNELDYLTTLSRNCPQMPMAWRAAGKAMGDCD